MEKKIIIGAMLVLTLLLLMPSIPAIQQKTIEKEAMQEPEFIFYEWLIIIGKYNELEIRPSEGSYRDLIIHSDDREILLINHYRIPGDEVVPPIWGFEILKNAYRVYAPKFYGFCNFGIIFGITFGDFDADF